MSETAIVYLNYITIMRIQELKIKNFRGISDLKLAFNPDINTIVLIGINGVGKTSILDCLSILLSKFIFDISTSIQIEKNLLSMGKYPDPDKDHTIKTLNFTDSDQKDHNQQTQAQIKFDWENYQDIIFSIPFSNVDNQMPLVGEIQDKLRAKEKTNIPLAIYYNVNRNQLDISLELLDNMSDQIDAYKQALTEKKISFKSFFQWFRTVEDLENERFRDNNNYVDQQLEAVR